MTKKSQRLLLEAYPRIEHVARHLAYVYHSPRFDAEELTQVGALAVCEALKRGIHPTGDKIGYIVVIARRAMQRQMGIYQSLIRTPRTHDGYLPAMVVLSLDMPLFPGEETTLLDRLAEIAVDAADAFNAAYEIYADGLPGEEVQA